MLRGILLVSALACVQAGLEVTVHSDGSYEVLVGGRVWLESGKAEFYEGGAWSSPVPHVAAPTTGKDGNGAYNETVLTYQTSGYSIDAVIRAYQSGQLASFTTNFTTGMRQANAGTSADTTSQRFPTFKLQKPPSVKLGSIVWKGPFLNGVDSDVGPGIGTWPETTSTGKDGGPHVLFDMDSKDAVVVSHGSQFMQQSFEAVNGVLASGMIGGVTEVPAGFSTSTIITCSDKGVNNAVTAWGETLRGMYGKTAAHRDTDPILKVIGYNTDHGAYYYYKTSPNMTMDQTLLALKKSSDARGIPYKYILLDSWWYFKGPQQGVTNWTAMPEWFPPGGDDALKTFTETTNWMVIGHNRYWDRATTYSIHNGGEYNFSDDGPGHYVVPLEQRFWDFLMESSKAWGLTTYEQDWLFNEFNGVPYLQRSPTMARDWLLQMGRAAAKNGLTIQYCMPYPRHALQSVEIPVVTQIRASGDYVPGGNRAPVNWNIGGSSILAHALALAPFKDNFWTSTQEPGGSCGSTINPDVWRHAAVATLSRGPVTPADGIDFQNKSLIMRACRADGVLLRPARPVTYLDSMIYKRAGGAGPKGHVWSTYTEVGDARYDIVFSMVEGSYSLHPSELTLDRGQGVAVQSVYYTRDTKRFTELVIRELDPVNGSIPLTQPATENDFELHYVSPVLANGWTVLGELTKWVPITPDRIVAIDSTGPDVTVSVMGAAGEEVTLTFYKKQVVQVTCTLGSDGTVVFNSSGSCS